MNKRQLQKEQTKQKIAKTAYMLYAQKGFQVSTNEIATLAKVSHGTVFVHFPTREDLIVFTLKEFGASITKTLHEHSIALSTVETTLFAHIDVLMEYEGFYTNFIREMYDLPTVAVSEFVSIQSAVSHHLEPFLKNETTLDVGLPLLFNSWLGLLHYYLLNKPLFSPNQSVLMTYRNELVDTFIKMIKKRRNIL